MCQQVKADTLFILSPTIKPDPPPPHPAPRTVYKLIYYTSPAIIQTAPWDRDRKCRQLYNLFLI